MVGVNEDTTGESGLLLLVFLVVLRASCSLTGPGDSASPVAELDARIPAVIAVRTLLAHRSGLDYLPHQFARDSGSVFARHFRPACPEEPIEISAFFDSTLTGRSGSCC
jgi:hypothetical protein